MSDLTRSIPSDPPTTDATPPIAGAEPTTSDDWKGSPDLSRGANSGLAAPPGYELREEVGHGGMGVVYRARDVAFGRDVAVKVLADRYSADSPAAHRFVYEARITGQLQHPGIPAAH
jgi:serine/threonine protein kinase